MTLSMAQVLVRGLDDAVVARLKEIAAKNQRSLEAELRAILSSASIDPILEAKEIRQSFPKVFVDGSDLLRMES